MVLAHRERRPLLILASIGFVAAAIGSVVSAIQSAMMMIEVNSTGDLEGAIPPLHILGGFIRWVGLGGVWLGSISLLCHAFTHSTRRAT
jgi:hypothetical protein